ncbi:ribose 5-phosphate isomerase A [Inconstantimicrobium mannanitabidum]|uniref:Ribose-5-phosphate isomerase n=1 Tax=Inconstantimicrobium mannanitabidum TaxID=1604901 RepID=A0ACB5RE58_9CLOT|nr:ribose 5-phosphate isomerase A [Clostridium sp. TW13]GKX67552.1 ribose-5-phosphate isomerase [Clostridium sp. TW13]
MDEENLRKVCAEKAIGYIKNNTVIGLGAGRNIACLIELISKEIQHNLKIKIVTPSDNTRSLCIKYGVEVVPTCFVDEIDVAFDGCGEVDEMFYASKGGGGIFSKEKLIASMAKEYILLIDEKKLTKKLNCKCPISLEITKDSLAYVSTMVRSLGGNPVARVSYNKDGYLITDDGNLLLDIKFEDIRDLKKLNNDLNEINGVIATSIFTKEVTKIIVAGDAGVRIISRT